MQISKLALIDETYYIDFKKNYKKCYTLFIFGFYFKTNMLFNSQDLIVNFPLAATHFLVNWSTEFGVRLR